MIDTKKAKELNEAIVFDAWIDAHGDHIDALASKLTGLCFENKIRKRTDQYLPQANTLIANFLICRERGNRWLSIPFSSTAYPGGRYKEPVTKAIIVDGLIRTLIKLDLVEYVKGYRSDKRELYSEGRNTRIRPKGRLKNWIKSCNGAEIRQKQLTEPVHVQVKEKLPFNPKIKQTKSKNILVDYIDTPFTNELRNNLRTLNKFINPAFVDIWLPDPIYKEALKDCKYYSKQYYCVYNDPEFTKGGRLYGHYIQQIKKRYRPYITINHVMTQELDYVGLHPNIMYHQAGAEMEGDPYLLDVDFYNNSLRDSVKRILFIMTNCTSYKQTKRAIQDKVNKVDNDKIVLVAGLDIDYQIETIIQALLNKHHVIADRFFQPVPAGWALQVLDSKIALGVMLEMMHVHKAVALSIHDSFIVQSTYVNALKTSMVEVYRREVGYTPQISEFINTELGLRIDEGSSCSHSLYEQRALQYLKNKGEVPENPLDTPDIFPAV
jgi:hypothetical protein